MSSALKTELLALLKGSGRLARVWEELDDDRALLKRWVNDWPQPEHEVLWKKIEAGARKLERVPMRLSHLSTVMPALVAGIHVLLAGRQQAKALMAGTSPAMTPEKWLNMTGTCP